MKWTIVAFDHPEKSRSVLYRQSLTNDALIQAIRIAIGKGANLMSIRGFKEPYEELTKIMIEEVEEARKEYQTLIDRRRKNES